MCVFRLLYRCFFIDELDRRPRFEQYRTAYIRFALLEPFEGKSSSNRFPPCPKRSQVYKVQSFNRLGAPAHITRIYKVPPHYDQSIHRLTIHSSSSWPSKRVCNWEYLYSWPQQGAPRAYSSCIFTYFPVQSVGRRARHHSDKRAFRTYLGVRFVNHRHDYTRYSMDCPSTPLHSRSLPSGLTGDGRDGTVSEERTRLWLVSPCRNLCPQSNLTPEYVRW
jgi:hypothetical protein